MTESVATLTLQDSRLHLGGVVHFDNAEKVCADGVKLLQQAGKKVVRKQIIETAVKQRAGIIVLEDLTNIRSRIKGGKRLRTRLHRWGFSQLQTFITYKAEAQGVQVIYVNPAYSSQECSVCGGLGVRKRHRFTCSCGNQQHADVNASRNLCRFALGLPKATCAVNRTQVVAS